jgi:hypothetical protein
MADLLRNSFYQTTVNRLFSNALGHRIEGGSKAEGVLGDEKSG